MGGGGALRRTPSYSSVIEDYSDAGERRGSNSRKSSIGSDYESYSDEFVITSETEKQDILNTSTASSATEGKTTDGNPLDDGVSGAPLRRISLFGKGAPSARRTKRTVVVHSSKDINPLAPCGACNEWLKKIAESNPYFQIITFTDARCNGVYISPCQE